ncbi:hypothetical protein BU24DRAFT_149714 [Aaosphaeria arxii CBS 175.79]|uniref:Carbohydrate esterase family 16 protein n=1 Tax=Aaosphaeria arxii CBS 175.79 TaxID=1450172 RepID=A0A6A5XWW9_9PLEO|nr:uncharacterized protein BU24DRAFT_149714 [Aaosphaeria arxii CBS 175.79]KAF2017393.1 hypothetical protein BU24DRAFT_149714 [Aaosphaeria arxii CBS 175.79]
MKAPNRLLGCLAISIILFLFCNWLRPMSHIPAGIQDAWKEGNTYRLVVFGDDWSDIGKYRVSPPPLSTIRDRDPDRGDMWTEALCRELNCGAIHNYARSKPANMNVKTIGSMVDSNVLVKASAGEKNGTLALFDLSTQVQQFLDQEDNGGFLRGRVGRSEGPTMFTIFFGFWDLLEFASLEKQDAIRAVEESIEALFRNLDLLAEHAHHPVQVVIPMIMDPTFLPVFQDRRNDFTSVFAHYHHKAVFLWTAWNTALSQAAAKWDRGDAYVPDTNDIVISQVRQKQLLSKHIPDGPGLDKQAPLFDNVEQPCLSPKQGNGGEVQGDDVVEKCFDPTRHLFWDSIHLSGRAHQLIGQDAARLVRGNMTANSATRQQGLDDGPPAENKKYDQKNSPGFNLKFPPGY